MSRQSEFAKVLGEAEALLEEVAPHEANSALYLLSCQAAYARRSQIFLSFRDLGMLFDKGRKKPDTLDVLTEGLTELVRVLRGVHAWEVRPETGYVHGGETAGTREGEMETAAGRARAERWPAPREPQR